MTLKTSHKILIGVGIFIVLVAFWAMISYNGLVSADETVNEKWANVQTAYQRRADLIPNLVATVQQYTNYEGEVLTEITQARASIGKATTPQDLAAAGQQMDSALSRLLVVAENYPDLKANENYLSLQDELAGTENRVKVERDLFNKAVKEFNIKVRRFPTSIMASWGGFETKQSFEAQAGTQNAPDVNTLFEE
ncbi:LemA family protein [Candidatus Woesearchaeota archaeon]|nr:LemA family protein [Candidatus Woesearchaeota archaeon]